MAPRAADAPDELAGLTDPQFAILAEQHTNFVYNVAFRIMNSPDDAEDAVQDAFIAAYRARHRFGGDAQVTTCLYRITVNPALMRIRRDKRRAHMTAPEDSYQEHNVTVWKDAPDKAALNSELRREIQSKIAMLPTDMREAVVLRDVRQLTGAEAAGVLGITVAALKARLHRGRVVLRDLLAEYVGQRYAPMAWAGTGDASVGVPARPSTANTFNGRCSLQGQRRRRTNGKGIFRDAALRANTKGRDDEQ